MSREVIYKCDVCGVIVNRPSKVVRVKCWLTKTDVCLECWRKFKSLRRNERNENGNNRERT